MMSRPDAPPIREATPEFLDGLRALLGPRGLREGDAAAPYLAEPRDRIRGKAALVVRPGSTEQVAEVVRRCAAESVGVVPYAGGTGLVGGQVRADGPAPVVLSVERLDRVRARLADDDALIVEAGAILADVQKAAEEIGRLFPLSLASEGSARIGGLLGTNAGGVSVLRYGNARDLTLGIEAVLPDGSVLHGLKTLRKDNTGYDLRHLLIGSEGTLGVITAAALKLFPRPAETATAFCAVRSPGAALELLHLMREVFGETVSAFELIGRAGLDFLAEHAPDLRLPLAQRPEWSVLTETGGSAGSEQARRMETALTRAYERGLVDDAALAASESQRAAMWRLRETIPEANRKVGAVSSHDVSVPLSRIAEFIDEGLRVVAAIDPALRVNCFGHLGDGNLHYNVFPPAGGTRADHESRREEIKRALHDLVSRFEGSCSAEHGIGRLKTADLARYADPAKLAAMRAIKSALDPKGVMNPGAVIPPGPG